MLKSVHLFILKPSRSSDVKSQSELINKPVKIEAKTGQTILQAISKYDELKKYIPGNCGGKCACSTCHISFQEKDFKRFKLGVFSDEEEDMIWNAYNNEKEFSRLACQVPISEEMDGMIVQIEFNGYDTV